LSSGRMIREVFSLAPAVDDAVKITATHKIKGA
jgi:hypothetical protein